MKICSKCKQNKENSEFRNHPQGRDGLHSICVQCQRDYAKDRMRRLREVEPEKVKAAKKKHYQKERSKFIQYAKDYYENNKPKLLEKAAKYRKIFRDRILKWQREYYKNNKEKKKESDSRSRKKNIEKVKARMKNYRKNNISEIIMRNRLRRQKIKFSKKDFSQADWNYCLNYWGNKCAVCGSSANEEKIISMDHWIPLKLDGSTDKRNIIPLCHGVDGCNNKKNAKNPVKWLFSEFSFDFANKRLSDIEKYFSSLS